MNWKVVSSVFFVVCVSIGVLGAEPEGKSSRPSGVPEGAESWLVLPAPAKTMARIGPAVDAFAPGKGPAAVLTLRGLITKYSGKALDESKPVVCIASPGKKPRFAMAASLVAGGDVTKILEVRFGKAGKTEGGVSTYFEVQDGALPDKEIYVSVKAGRVVVGDDIKLVSLLAAASRPAPGSFADGVDFIAGVDVKKVSDRNKEDLAELLKKLETGGARAGKRNSFEKALGNVGSGFLKSAIRNVEIVTAEGALGGAELSVAMNFEAIKGGEFETALKKLSGAKLPILRKVPGKPMIKVVGATDPAVSAQILGAAKPVLMSFLADGGDEQLKKELTAALEAAAATTKHIDGTVCETIQRRKGGICVLLTSGVTDSAAARASILKAYEVGLTDGLKKKWKELGLSFEVKEKHRKSGAFDVDLITTDITFPPHPGVPPEFQARVQEMQRKMMDGIYGLPMVYEFTFRDKQMLTAFGKDAPKALDELVRIAAAGKAADVMTTRKRIPKGAFVAAEVDVLEYAYMLVDVMGRTAQPGMMPEVNFGADPAKPASVWAVARDGKLTVRYNVPVAPVKRVVAGFRKARKEMIEKIMQQHQPVPPPDPGAEQF